MGQGHSQRSWWPRFGAFVAGVVLAGGLAPMYTANAAEGTFTFAGGGYGHSVGMSQFGAYGMALEGFSWTDILSHYFTGASPGPVDAALAARPLWVNLQVERPSVSLTVRATGSAPTVPVVFTSAAGTVAVVAGETVTISRSGDTCTVTAPAGSFSGPCAIDAQWDGWSGSPTTAFVIAGCSQMNWNLASGSQQQPCTYARGTLHLRPDNNTATIAGSIEIAMEDYILGISEMPYFWGDSGGQAALEAQAVAARSYAYARLLTRGTPESRPWCWCQLYDTPVDQNYVGWGHGTQHWIDAVRSTAGQVMFHPGATRNGVQVPIDTFYSSSTFGWTENSEDSFTATLPYTKAVDDHWSGLAAVRNGNFRWTRTFTASQLTAALPGMASVTGATITRCSASGAALEITFTGSGGPRTFHTRELRGTLGLRSQQVYAINGVTGCSSGAVSTSSTTTTTTTVTETTTTTVTETTTTTTTPAPTTTTTVAETTTTTAAEATTTTLAPEITTTTVAEATTTTIAPAPTTTTTIVPTTTTTVPVADTTTTTVPPVTTTTVPVAGAACPLISLPIDALIGAGRSLRAGTSGPAVSQLQALLSALGHYDGPVDGVFGRLTTAAVRSFQDARGLFTDGVVGSRTRSELMVLRSAAENGRILASDGRLLRRGTAGDQVRALQQLLNLLGFNPGPIDGAFGSRTDRAVAAFQRASSLHPDGIVGTESRAALAAALGLGSIVDCR
ncbi:MAG: peptidoglycan-binding protein [Acidimicrobiia bacterium]|nr:peptidoglycan-binding protein [Acidimicrobiia bacterium]